MLQGAAANGLVVILNPGKAGCPALILTLTSVHHIPFLDLSYNEVTVLVKLIHYATAKYGRDASLPELSCGCVEDLIQQMPLFSDTLQLFGLPFD
jgi:hypothetical protein